MTYTQIFDFIHDKEFDEDVGLYALLRCKCCIAAGERVSRRRDYPQEINPAACLGADARRLTAEGRLHHPFHDMAGSDSNSLAGGSPGCGPGARFYGHPDGRPFSDMAAQAQLRPD